MMRNALRPAVPAIVACTGANSTFDPALEVRDLWMRYGDAVVLRGVDLRVEPGEIHALLGPNGAGKTTTIEICEGFRTRSAGDVAVLGADPDSGNERWRARIGTVLQSWRDHQRWRVRDFLHHIGYYYRPYSDADRKRPYDTDALLHRVGLSAQGSKTLARLSGGQRRRLDVAVGLVGNPELIFLDEPTVGFDPEARYEFHELIREVSGTDGTSIVLTTHDLAEAEKLANRISVLIDGRIVASGSAAALASRFSGMATIRYTLNGSIESTQTPDPCSFLKGLLNTHEHLIRDLEVRPASLEDTYLQMVREFDSTVRQEAAAS